MARAPLPPLRRGVAGPLPYAAIGEGPPLVVIAGLSPVTGVEGDWLARLSLAPFAPLTARRQVTLLNRRSHLPRGMTFAALAAEHAEALRKLSDDPVDVVGISTGGSIAQQLAADHPRAVRRLVLASTGDRLEGEAKQLQRRVAARIRGGAPRRALAVLTGDLVGPWRGQIALALLALLAGPLVVNGQGDLDDLATTIEAEDTFDLARCPAIRAPTLIVAGSRDRFYSAEAVRRTAALIPGSELVIVEGRGHVTAISDRRFADALRRFVG